MNILNQLRKKPFNLNEEALLWVKKTINSMTIEEKIGQLFFLVAYKQDEHFVHKITKDIAIGGIMSRTMDSGDVKKLISTAQASSKIPLLMAANLETGGNGVAKDGTKVGSPMMIAATNNNDNAYEYGKVCAKEAKLLGINYSFSPICDIDLNFRNPITNTRTFGNDIDRIINMSNAYINAFDEKNLLTAAKHFPGDGVDERDQHLVTTVNDLSVEKWDETYGKIYRSLINKGIKTIMAGHISLPAYEKYFEKFIKDEEILPASLSKNILKKLLRTKLNFNGLIISDATTMAGFNIPMSRKLAVPTAIENGCDMFLFTKNLDEDIEFMKSGYQQGILSEERLEEAVLRILATKASIGLHLKQSKPKGKLKDEKSLEIAERVADNSITLVKEESGVLPIDQRYKNILIYGIEGGNNALGYIRETEMYKKIGKALSVEGYNIEYFEPGGLYEGVQKSFLEVKDSYDLIIYVANLATKSNQTVVRIEWMNPMGLNVPYYINSIPTIFISTENPYHLLDVPRIKTYINTYGVNDYTVKYLIDKLLGKSAFKGVSPIDPFCGKWDTRL